MTTVAINDGQPLKMRSDTNTSLSSLHWSKLMASHLPIKCRCAGLLPIRPGTGPPPVLLCIPGNPIPQGSLPLAFMQVQPVGGTCPRLEGRWGGGRDARVFSLLPSALWHSWQGPSPLDGPGRPGKAPALWAQLSPAGRLQFWPLDPGPHPSSLWPKEGQTTWFA